MPVTINARGHSIGIILAITLLSIALGIFLDGEVVPEPVKPITWEIQENEAATASIKPSQSTPQKSIKTLNEETTVLQQKGERVIEHADTLISQTGLSVKQKNRPQSNEKMAQQIQDIKSRLNKLNR
ncbi:MAG: hypothetical protein ABW168_11620 [Sedimenticola sp.]